jgi:transposase-like protein
MTKPKPAADRRRAAAAGHTIVAAALAYADTHGVAAAADRFGIAPGTVRSWRSRLTNPAATPKPAPVPDDLAQLGPDQLRAILAAAATPPRPPVIQLNLLPPGHTGTAEWTRLLRTAHQHGRLPDPPYRPHPDHLQ